MKDSWTHKIEIRCAGTKAQYYVLKLMKNGEVYQINTSKDLAYLNRMTRKSS